MKTRRTLFLAALAGLACCTFAQQRTPQPRFGGQWRVIYQDAEIGTVVGAADIARDERSGTVTLLDPKEGRTSFTLDASDIRRDGAKLTLTLRGASPHGNRRTIPDARLQHLVVGADAREITAQAAGGARQARLQALGRVDQDRIDLTLSFDEHGDLVGGWQYHAHPDSERYRDGYGRVGTFSRGEEQGKSVAFQEGPEKWERVRPVVVGTVVLEDQMEWNSRVNAPRYGYPYDSNPNLAGPRLRTLMVYGWHLPRRMPDVPEIVPADGPVATVEYIPTALSDRPTNDTVQAGQLAEGWSRILKGQTPEAQAVMRRMDALILRVNLRPGALAGARTFRLDEAEGTWELLFGFVPEEAAFHRLVRTGGTEPATELLAPSNALVQIDLHGDVPLAVLPVRIERKRGSEVTRVLDIDARPLAANPRTYQTPPLTLYEEGREKLAVTKGESGIGVRPGDELRIVHVLTGKPPPAGQAPSGKATVMSAFRIGSLWKQALLTAIRTKPDYPLPSADFNQLSVEQTKDIANVILFDRETRHIRVSAGQHACMLLLCDTFLDMMEEEKPKIPKLRDENDLPEVEAFLRARFVDCATTSSDAMHVPAPEGYHSAAGAVMSNIITLGGRTRVAGVPFRLVYSESFREGIFHGDQAKYERFRWESVRSAYAQYIIAVDKAIDRTKELKKHPENIDGLLDLVGDGFEPVAERLRPRLVRLEEKVVGGAPRYEWVTDTVARSYLDEIPSLVDAVRKQRAYSEGDTAFVMAVAGVAATVPAMIWSTSVAAVGVAIAADAVNGITGVYDAYHEVAANWREQDFAKGASLVIGLGRYDSALAADPGIWMALGNITVSAIGSALSVSGSLDRIQSVRVVKKLQQEGVAAFRGLSGTEKEAFMHFAEECKVTETCNRDAKFLNKNYLTATQHEAIALYEEMYPETKHFGNAKPIPGATELRPRPAPPEAEHPMPTVAQPTEKDLGLGGRTLAVDEAERETKAGATGGVTSTAKPEPHSGYGMNPDPKDTVKLPPPRGTTEPEPIHLPPNTTTTEPVHLPPSEPATTEPMKLPSPTSETVKTPPPHGANPSETVKYPTPTAETVQVPPPRGASEGRAVRRPTPRPPTAETVHMPPAKPATAETVKLPSPTADTVKLPPPAPGKTVKLPPPEMPNPAPEATVKLPPPEMPAPAPEKTVKLPAPHGATDAETVHMPPTNPATAETVKLPSPTADTVKLPPPHGANPAETVKLPSPTAETVKLPPPHGAMETETVKLPAPHGAMEAETVKLPPPGGSMETETVKLPSTHGATDAETVKLPPPHGAARTETVKLPSPEMPAPAPGKTVKLPPPEMPPPASGKTAILPPPDLPPAVSEYRTPPPPKNAVVLDASVKPQVNKIQPDAIYTAMPEKTKVMPEHFYYQDGKGNLLKLEKVVGEGHYSVVYSLGGEGNENKLAKFCLHPDSDSVGVTLANAEAAGKPITEKEASLIVRRQEVTDVARASENLQKAGIDQARVLHVGLSGEDPYVIVEKLDASLVPPKDLQDKLNLRAERKQLIERGQWGPEHEKAVIRLYGQLADAGLVAEDLHAENIFFRRQPDGSLRAGILDHGHIGVWDEAKGKLWFDDIKRAPPAYGINSMTGGQSFKTPEEFMAKMFEHKLYIRFDPASGAYEGLRMDLENFRGTKFEKYIFTKARPAGLLAPQQRFRPGRPGALLPLRQAA